MSVTRGIDGLIASICFSSLSSSTILSLRYCTRSPGAPARLTMMSGTSTKAGGFGGGAATEDGEQTDGHDDELELVLRRSGFRAFDGCAAFRFIVCHGR